MIDAAHPDVVGRYLIGDQAFFYPVKRPEVDRAAVSPARNIASFAIAPGRYVLTISLTQEFVQFAPFEQACQQLGLLGTNADASAFDAKRVESLIRQFDVAAICGIDAGVLDGLADLGHDAATILAGRVVWARPDAFDRVAAMPGVNARRCATIGPVLGLECVEGEGMHIDGREWIASAPGGTIILDSRLPRLTPLVALDTGVAGDVVTAPCRCGSPDPRLVLAN